MDIAVTGTRYGWTDQQKASISGRLGRYVSLRHGGCKGIDVQMARLVKQQCKTCLITCHPGPEGDEWQEASGVDDDRLPPKSHFARNREMVDSSKQTWVVPKEMERQERGGTWYTYDYAIKKGKRVVVFWPDGTVTETPPKEEL